MDLHHLFVDSMRRLLLEIVEGPPQDAAFVLSPGDAGLIRSLRRLSAQKASQRPDGRSSVAAHVRHLSYGFELLNRWAQGEDPRLPMLTMKGYGAGRTSPPRAI